MPNFPTADVVKIPAAVLRTLIGKTIFAISNEESRYTLNGALMVLKPESITMVATDGHRLAHIENTNAKFKGVSGELKTLVPKKAMAELNSLLQASDADEIEFYALRLDLARIDGLHAVIERRRERKLQFCHG